MRPECRTKGEEFPIPQFSIENRKVQAFMEELRGFHEEFRHCLVRSESRDNFFRYMVGQLSELERKCIEPIALQVEGGNVRSLQKVVADAVWDDPKLLNKYHTLVKDNAVDLSPFVGPFAMAAFGFTREFAAWAGTVSSPGDPRHNAICRSNTGRRTNGPP